ncbi:phosphopantothenoylcysteine decarboxylase/phosphopantothenate--cysteine ligase [Salinisphaera sp. PC39]|uniref:bifunctional phosphopantothenoylcysteine decarboxylase/phosphopantothenate--cysteine ligase CoaBC n=1 Tax=Salinisphaera sp. PC39 TaxID=1304156 RepID=UPI00333F1C8C
MSALQNRRILLGVTGGIAAYKAADLTRRLVEAGAEVQVVMTDGAQRFITPLTLQAVSGRAVRTSLWDESAELGMGHIELARWADLVLVAPATADLIARLAQGRADDLLTTLCLATEAPLMVAPAMNRVMWAHPATRANCDTLRERGVTIAGPGEGELAERESGPGRMLEPLDIRERVIAHFAGGALSGRRVLVTAGPTREPLDPVRYLSNRSSGRMGFAVAAAAAAAGAEVTLVTGPVALATPPGVARVDVETAQQMFDAVAERAADADILIAAAAVADYRPETAAAGKIKKTDAAMTLDLARTRDILAETAAAHPDLFAVGFAAETDDMETYARGKLRDKGLDMVVGNEVGPDKAFDREDNTLYVCWPGGEARFATASKTALARDLVTLVAERLEDSTQT